MGWDYWDDWDYCDFWDPNSHNSLKSPNSPMLIDYHVHNHFSPDSDADSAEMLKNLRKEGVLDMCFTNHGEWFDHEKGDHVGKFDLYEAMRRFESVLWEIEQLRPAFPELKIRFGAEITYSLKDLPNIEQWIKDTPFDFLLGSVHNVGGHIITTHLDAPAYFKEKKEEEAYLPYFEQLIEMVQWGQFDVVAHLDVIKKYGHQYYGPFQPKKYKAPILKALKIMKEKGLGIELNSRSLHVRCQELFPHPDILKWALEIGIEHFTLSSDSHTPKDAGLYVKEALEIARDVGIKTVSTYEKRKPTRYPLDKS